VRIALLLDFDGVIMKRNPLFPDVSKRCHKYIQKYIPIRNIENVEELNTQLYQATGHTVLGLQQLGFPASVSEFNQYIYDSLDFKKLSIIEMENKEENMQFTSLLCFCNENNIDPYIFSNAPPKWVSTTLSYMLPKSDLLSRVRILKNPHNKLKPTTSLYDSIEDNVLFDYDQIVFVDDKVINLLPVICRPKWNVMLLTNAIQDEPYLSICDGIGMVHDLNDVQMALHNTLYN
jgi:hypothetical protein